MSLTAGLRRHGKLLAVILLAAVTAFGGLFYEYKVKTQTQTAVGTTVVVERGDIASTVSATGTISAVNSVDIASRVTGLITEVRVKENDQVKAGQILVMLDDTALKAQLDQYQAQLQNYAAIYERSKELAAIGGESSQQLDADRTNYLVAKSTYNNFALQLEYYVIKSPIDGMVVGTPTPAGQTVAQGISSPQVIMTIADMSKMQIKVMVDETDIGRVKVGQHAIFTVDAYPDNTFTGKVTSISRSAITSSNVIYYPVYVEVDSPQDLLYPTMTARVTIHVAQSKNTLLVPLAAVKQDKGQKYIQVQENGGIKNMPVKLGLSNDEKIEVLNGLNEGDIVLLPAVKSNNKANQMMPPPPI